MRFQPKTEAQLIEESLIQPGEYFFSVASSENKTSKNGNEMILIKVDIWDGAKRIGTVYDYLLEAMSFKLRHCCESCGLLEKYDSGEILASDFVGKSGKCRIDIQQAQSGYDAKNVIKDYIKSESVPQHVKDGLPF